MSDWDRIQRLELELKQLEARIKRMDDLNLHLQDEVETLTRERDTARAVAVRLEQEIAWVPVVGTAT